MVHFQGCLRLFAAASVAATALAFRADEKPILAADAPAPSVVVQQDVRVVSDNEVFFPNEGGPYSAVWVSAELQPSDKRRCFAFDISGLQESPFVGVVPPTNIYARGYALQPLGFGGPGNLVSTRGCAYASWAKAATNEIQFMIEYGVGGSIKMWFKADGVAQGLGFDLQDDRFAEAAFPAVSGSGGSVKFSEVSCDKMAESREEDPEPTRFVTAAPSWEALGFPMAFSARKQGSRVSVHLGNQLWFTADAEGKIGGVASTLALSSGKNYEAETKFTEFVTGATLQMADDDASHFSIVKGEDRLDFEADHAAPEPVTAY